MPRRTSQAPWPTRAAAIAAAAVLGACVVPDAPPGRWSLFALAPRPEGSAPPRAVASPTLGAAGSSSPDGPASADPRQPPVTPPPRRGGSGGSGGGAPLPAPTETPTDAPWPGAPAEPTQPPGCSPCDDGPRAGVVLAAEAPYAPLAGVAVSAGAATATSAADGSFALPPPSASAELVTLARSGRATAVVAGWRAGALTLHLAAGVPEPAAGAANGPAAGGLAVLGVSGRVVDGAGLPVAGAAVTAGAPDGAWAPAAATAADGTFALRVQGASASGVANATIWATVAGADGAATRFGALAGLALAADQDVGDLALAAPTGEVALAAPLTAPFAATPAWELVAVGPGGTTCALARRGATDLRAPAFAVPGVALEVRAAATGHDGATASYWRRAAAAGDAVAPAFALPPVPSASLALAAGSAWTWRPIAGMGGYRVEVRGASALQRWEAFTELPRLTLPAGVPAAPARVRIVATGEGGLFALAGLRALRLFAAPESYSVWEGSL